MIREGKYSDIPALMMMLRRQHRRSKYAGRMELHDKSMEQLLMGAVAGQRQSGPNGSYIAVAEHQGKITGFVVGMLSRVYNIGDKLVASDIFLFNENKSVSDLTRLINGYVYWASQNPKVIEIGLSWSDAIVGGQSMATLYKRKGFKLSGEQYELRTDREEAVAA